LVSDKDLIQTALHEAGHVVLNNPELSGEKVEFVTVRGSGNFGGYARYGNDNPKFHIDREIAKAKIARLLAGSGAERLSGHPRSSGWSSDLSKAKKLARIAITVYGLSENALEIPLLDEKDKYFKSNKLIDEEVSKLLKESEELADKQLKENWAKVQAIAEELYSVGHIKEEKINEILAAVEKKGEIINPEKAQELMKNIRPSSSTSICASVVRSIIGK